ncbi:MAG: C45 family autoproteolytic acyltransferase/hydrolase [Candidatus Sericytochromatia bacterium]
MSDKNNIKLVKKNNFYCINVEGSPYDIGFQKGTLLKPYFNDSVYDFFSNYIINTLKKSSKIRPSVLAVIIDKVLKTKVSKFTNRVPEDIKNEIKGFCEALNIDYHKYLDTFVLPETIGYLIYHFTNENYALKTHLSGAELLGCTSIVAKSRATENAEIYHARNLDTFGLGKWEKFPLISYIKPNNAFKYVSISTIGFNTGVITGVNEKKITYALHKNYTSDYIEDNLPILALGELIMKYADSIEKAIDIIKSSKANGGWSVVLSDGKTRDSCVVEISGDEVEIRRNHDDILICTNSYLSPNLHELETIVNPIFNISSNIRYQRAEQLTEKYFMQLNAEKLSIILSDRYDTTAEEEKIYGYTISQNNTVSSVIFRPEKNSFWIANGKVPVCNSDYEYFSTDFKDIEKNYDRYKIKGALFSTKGYDKAWNFIYEAHLEYEKNNYKESAKLISKAIEICGINETPLYFIYGILKLKIYDYATAKEFFQKAYDNEADVYKSGVLKIWLGRIFDLLGDREKALKQYRYVGQMNKKVYGDLISLSIKGQKKPYKKSLIKYINLDISFGEEIISQ